MLKLWLRYLRCFRSSHYLLVLYYRNQISSYINRKFQLVACLLFSECSYLLAEWTEILVLFTSSLLKNIFRRFDFRFDRRCLNFKFRCMVVIPMFGYCLRLVEATKKKVNQNICFSIQDVQMQNYLKNEASRARKEIIVFVTSVTALKNV